MQRGFKKWCEQQSVQLRKELGLLPHHYLSARVLAAYLAINVVGLEAIPGLERRHREQLLYHDPTSWSAVTIRVDGCTLVIHNPTHSPARQEANIMHEVAHVICNHEPARFRSLPGLPFPLRGYRKEDEEEAEWLGGCLQIPRAGLMWVLRQGTTRNKEIAAHFVASVKMVQYRRNVTGVDKEMRGRRQWG